MILNQIIMKVRRAFGEILREIRTDQGLTQEKLALRSEVSMQMISLMECAKFQPTLETLFALTDGLGISVSYLMEAVEKRVRD